VILLGIDTCGSIGTLALGRVEQDPAGPLVFVGSSELPGRSAAAMLVPSLDRLLRDSGLQVRELAGLVVVDGPGSFTGIRIGLSSAKALAEAARLNLYAISRLLVLAHAGQSPCAALDAGRGEFYFGSWVQVRAASPDEGTEVWEEWLLTGQQLLARLRDRPAGADPCCVCEQNVASVLDQAGISLRLVDSPTAAQALLASLTAVRAGRPTELAGLDGRYLRRSDLYHASL
jgi:tRNA threonylcarbamoyladenosine biosynthesis protein TsaB